MSNTEPLLTHISDLTLVPEVLPLPVQKESSLVLGASLSPITYNISVPQTIKSWEVGKAWEQVGQRDGMSSCFERADLLPNTVQALASFPGLWGETGNEAWKPHPHFIVVTCIVCILLNRSWAHVHLYPAVSLGRTVHRHTPGGRRKEQDSDRRQ